MLTLNTDLCSAIKNRNKEQRRLLTFIFIGYTLGHENFRTRDNVELRRYKNRLRMYEECKRHCVTFPVLRIVVYLLDNKPYNML